MILRSLPRACCWCCLHARIFAFHSLMQSLHFLLVNRCSVRRINQTPLVCNRPRCSALMRAKCSSASFLMRFSFFRNTSPPPSILFSSTLMLRFLLQFKTHRTCESSMILLQSNLIIPAPPARFAVVTSLSNTVFESRLCSASCR